MRCNPIMIEVLLCYTSTAYAAGPSQQSKLEAENKRLRMAIVEKDAALDAAIRLLRKHPASSGNAQETSCQETPATPNASMFVIVPDQPPEEVRLKKQVAELLPLKDEMEKLKQDVAQRDAILVRYHAMFPWVTEIDQADQLGKDVMLKGIGKARMATNGDNVIIRLDANMIAKGDKYMEKTAKERYVTGAGESARVYYVLNRKAIQQK